MFFFCLKRYLQMRRLKMKKELEEYKRPLEYWKKEDWWRRWEHAICSWHLKHFPLKD